MTSITKQRLLDSGMIKYTSIVTISLSEDLLMELFQNSKKSR